MLEASPRSWRDTFAALRERDFAWFFTGNVAFFMAMQMNMLLRSFLAFELTNLAIALGVLGVSQALPTLFVAPIGGVLADRYNNRTMLMFGQAFITALNLLLAVLILLGNVEFWHLLVVTLGVGLGTAFVMPIRQAMVPQLVPQHRMTNAVSLQMGSINATRIVGPALGGFLIAPLGVGTVWTFGVALHALALLTVFALPRFELKRARAPLGFRADMLGGFRYVVRRPMLRLLLITGMVMPLFAFPVMQVLPVFAEDVFGRGPNALAALLAVSGIGGLTGSLIAANMEHMAAKGYLMLTGVLILGVCFIGFALTPFFPALLLFGVGNLGGMLFMTVNNATVQGIIDDEMRGRVMSMLMMSFGVMPLGMLPLTAAIDAFGASVTVAAASALMLGVLLLVFAFVPSLLRLRVDALEYAELSPSAAARLVASGKITMEEAERLTGRARPPRDDLDGPAVTGGRRPSGSIPERATEASRE